MADREIREFARPNPLGDARSVERAPRAGDPPMTIHPLVVATALAGWGWAVAAFWIVFLVLGNAPAIVAMVMVSFISLMMFGLMAGCGWSARRVAMRGRTKLRQPESFHEFLAGEAQIGADRMKGSELYALVLAMAVTLAILGTGLAVGIGVA